MPVALCKLCAKVHSPYSLGHTLSSLTIRRVLFAILPCGRACGGNLVRSARKRCAIEPALSNSRNVINYVTHRVCNFFSGSIAVTMHPAIWAPVHILPLYCRHYIAGVISLASQYVLWTLSVSFSTFV